jgi:anaphase-promoting complex subunit 10
MSSPTSPNSISGPINVPEFLKELGEDAVWTLSSAKPGNGVENLRDNSLESFWQSDGIQPHLVTVQFHKRTKISEVWICSIFRSDESYSPAQVSIRIGSGPDDLYEIQVVEMKEPDGWIRIPLCLYSDPSLNNKKQTNINFKQKEFGNAKDFVRAYCVQIAILTNHQNGRDTHLRQVKIYGPRKVIEPGTLEIPELGHLVDKMSHSFKQFAVLR